MSLAGWTPQFHIRSTLFKTSACHACSTQNSTSTYIAVHLLRNRLWGIRRRLLLNLLAEWRRKRREDEFASSRQEADSLAADILQVASIS